MGVQESRGYCDVKEALRVEAGMSGSDFCDGLSLAGFLSGCKQDSEPVVVEVGEASA